MDILFGFLALAAVAGLAFGFDFLPFQPSVHIRPWPFVSSPEELRAERLLLDVLGVDRYRELNRIGELHLASCSRSGRSFVIREYPNVIVVIDDGRVTETLCIRSMEDLPSADLILIHYLLLKTDEDAIFQIASKL